MRWQLYAKVLQAFGARRCTLWRGKVRLRSVTDTAPASCSSKSEHETHKHPLIEIRVCAMSRIRDCRLQLVFVPRMSARLPRTLVVLQRRGVLRRRRGSTGLHTPPPWPTRGRRTGRRRRAVAARAACWRCTRPRPRHSSCKMRKPLHRSRGRRQALTHLHTASALGCTHRW